jgi:hypothetical protein
MKILSDHTRKNFTKISFQRLDVQTLRITVRWIFLIGLAQRVQGTAGESAKSRAGIFMRV